MEKDSASIQKDKSLKQKKIYTPIGDPYSLKGGFILCIFGLFCYSYKIITTGIEWLLPNDWGLILMLIVAFIGYVTGHDRSRY